MSQQTKVDQCATSEDPLACIIDIVKADQGNCPLSLVLLTQENCVPCTEVQALHEQAINDGVIQVLDITSKRALDIMKKNDIDAVPTLLLLDCNEKIIEPSD